MTTPEKNKRWQNVYWCNPIAVLLFYNMEVIPFTNTNSDWDWVCWTDGRAAPRHLSIQRVVHEEIDCKLLSTSPNTIFFHNASKTKTNATDTSEDAYMGSVFDGSLVTDTRSKVAPMTSSDLVAVRQAVGKLLEIFNGHPTNRSREISNGPDGSQDFTRIEEGMLEILDIINTDLVPYFCNGLVDRKWDAANNADDDNPTSNIVAAIACFQKMHKVRVTFVNGQHRHVLAKKALLNLWDSKLETLTEVNVNNRHVIAAKIVGTPNGQLNAVKASAEWSVPYLFEPWECAKIGDLKQTEKASQMKGAKLAVGEM